MGEQQRGERKGIAKGREFPVLRPCDFDECHSEEPFDYAQDKLRDEESRTG